MRLNINLATQPYEDARHFYLGWTVGLLALAVLTGGLLFLTGRSWRHAQEDRRHIANEKQKLAQLQEQQARDLAILNQPANREVRENSQFLNTLIRRKQFSWTQVFASLEKLMPGRLHVVSINPQLTEDDQILVSVLVAGDTRDKAIELVRNLEQSQTFRYAKVHSENVLENQSTGGTSVQFQITALYVPTVQAQQRSGD